MRRFSILLASLVLAVSACGEPSSEPRSESQPREAQQFPVTIEAANGSLVIEGRPERIVSLSATATEMLFAIGAGDQVVAVDDQSNYPPGVPSTDLFAYEPNVEAIAAYEPDLVVAAADAGLKSLSKVDITLLVQPAAVDLDDAFNQFEELGVATGHTAEAADEVARIEDRIEEITSDLPELGTGATYYHELDETYFTVTSETFIGQIYALADLENIADKADKDGTGYPQLSAEYIIEADPDFIFLADSECCGQTPERVARRPGWDEITAVTNGAVFDVGDDISSRWGPRVVDFLERVVGAIEEVKAAN